MLPAEQARGEDLLTLARTRFDPNLTPVEEQVLRHSCAYEDPADWTPNPTTPDPTRHETTGRPLPSSQLPTIRPTLIRWLLTTPDATALLEPRGLRIWNARLTEPLDLNGCHIPVRLELRYCFFDAPILLASADLPTLSLRNSTMVRRLDASFLKLQGLLYLEDITANDTLYFDGAAVAGEASFGNLVLTTTNIALSMPGTTIGHDLLLWPNFQSAGRLSLRGVDIGGHASLAGARLAAPIDTLDLDNATIKGTLYLTNKFECAGRVHMIDTEIGGQLNGEGATLTATGEAFSLSQARIRGSVLLRSIYSAGTIRLAGTEIGGQFNAEGSKFTTTGEALTLDQTKVNGSLFLRNLVCAGTIRLLGTDIGGQIDTAGANLTASGYAIFLDRCKFHGSVFLRNTRCSGTIRIFGVEIEGNLECDGATFSKAGDAFTLDTVNIRGNVFLRNRFVSAGTIKMRSTEIGGQLNFGGASILAFDSTSLIVRKDFLWFCIQNPQQTFLRLYGASSMWSLRDDKQSWPQRGSLILGSLQVQEMRLHDAPTDDDRAHDRWGKEHPLDARDRIAWLNLQPPDQLSEPQPWMQLARIFDEKGHKRDARRVVFELHRHQANARWQSSPIIRRCAILFARLEEQPFRILIPILLLASLSGSVFSLNKCHFAETSESAYKATHTPNPQAAPSYPKFQSFVYALENVLPIIKLGQDDKWAPDPAHTSTALYRTLVILRWFLILSGWVMGGILAAAVSARFRS